MSDERLPATLHLAHTMPAPLASAPVPSSPRESHLLRERRSRLFVGGRVQGRIVRTALMYWGFYQLAFWHLLFLYRYAEYRGEVLAGGRPSTFIELYSKFAQDNVAVLLCALPLLPVLMWDVLRVTHRVAGPLVRFQECLRSLARGEYVPFVRIRKGDYLVELEQAFNDYLGTLPEPGKAGSPLVNEDADGCADTVFEYCESSDPHVPVYVTCGERADPEADTLVEPALVGPTRVGPTLAEINDLRSTVR